MTVKRPKTCSGGEDGPPRRRRVSGLAARLGPLALAVLASANAAQAQDQPAVEKAPAGWAEGPGLTGDWGGQRGRLSDHGVTPYATYTTEAFETPGWAGIHSGVDWTSQLEFGLDVDAEKLAGWPAAFFHASFLWIEGTDPSERVGNLNTISSLSAPSVVRVYELWYKQVLAAVTVKVGQLVASDDFMVSPSAALYLNAGFGTYPTFTANINSPTYPLGGPGAFVAWQVTASLSLQSGAYVADAGPNDGGNHGFGWSTGPGWTVFSEVAAKTSLAGRPGLFKLGGYYDTARFTDLATGSRDQGNGSLYALGDQTLLGGGDASPTVTAFAGGGFSPQQDRNTVHYYLQGGVNVGGLLPTRPKDTVGLAASYTSLSGDFVRANRAAGTPVSSQEAIVELTYQAVITPFITLQPDLQIVVDANQSRRDSMVFVLRLVLGL